MLGFTIIDEKRTERKNCLSKGKIEEHQEEQSQQDREPMT